MTLKSPCILIPLLSFFLYGCTAVPLVISFDPGIEALREGEKEFQLGNYKNAESIFEKIYTSNTDLQTQNTALYNLTSTRIMLAKNREDLLSSLKLLNEWHETYPGVLYVENPNVLIAALKGHIVFLEQEQKEVIRQKKKIKNLEAKSKKDTKLIETQGKTITDLKEALGTLQHQIAELEAIDQQLQEKKKPL